MTQDHYHYHLQARRPGTYLALGVGMLTAYVAYLTGAVMAAAPVGAYLLIVIYRLLKNPSAGMRLGPTRLEIYEGRREKTVPLARIRKANVTRNLFSHDECVLEMSDGARETLPPEALPPARRLKREFAQRGISC